MKAPASPHPHYEIRISDRRNFRYTRNIEQTVSTNKKQKITTTTTTTTTTKKKQTHHKPLNIGRIERFCWFFTVYILDSGWGEGKTQFAICRNQTDHVLKHTYTNGETQTHFGGNTGKSCLAQCRSTLKLVGHFVVHTQHTEEQRETTTATTMMIIPRTGATEAHRWKLL